MYLFPTAQKAIARAHGTNRQQSQKRDKLAVDPSSGPVQHGPSTVDAHRLHPSREVAPKNASGK